MRQFDVSGMCLVAGLSCALSACASAENSVRITTDGERRCIVSNGLPDHDTGRFPNRGNPHSISEQRHRFCFPLHPVKGAQPRPWTQIAGIALNGIPIRPGTADFWDPNSPRGFSRHGDRRWRLEGLGNAAKLGMDRNNAHVDHRGVYHYHGTPVALVGKEGRTLIGYAADGFEIHAQGDARRSSYRLKEGTRPSGPGGRYDGQFLADWEYVPGSGDLDQCNGGMLDGKFVYFVTMTYPFYPRCLWGQPSDDFAVGRGGPDRDRGRPSGFGSRRHPPGGHRHPPPRRY